MKINYKYLVLCLFITKSLYCLSQTSKFTKPQKLEDFEFLYKTLRDNYMNFESNKRLNQVDWIKNYDKYKFMIEKSESDSSFMLAVSSILSDLHNGHTDIYPTIMYDMFYNAYKTASKEDSNYNNYINTLENNTAIKNKKYWHDVAVKVGFIKKNKKQEESNTGLNDKYIEEANCLLSFLEKDSIAILKIKSFEDKFIASDSNQLFDFFTSISNHKNLIIDIQGNGGGNSKYWQEFILPYLITKPIYNSNKLYFKNTTLYRKFKPNLFAKNKFEVDSSKNSIFGINTLSYNDVDTIIHKNLPAKKFFGNVYLLVDRGVFSSAELLTIFCKETRLAKILGQTTSGDGMGGDPILLVLQNTGIIVRFSAETGLNEDGTSNAEIGTRPDVILKSQTQNQRTAEAIEIIKR